MGTVGNQQTSRTVDDEGNSQLSMETMFQTLGSRRRRYALHYLRQQDRPVSIRELSEQLAAWEVGKEPSSVTPKERKRLYTALHQTHLPRMDSLDVVNYDRNRGVVSTTSHIEQFNIFLDVVPERDLPWSQFYLALGAVLTALITVATLGVAPFDAVSGFGYAIGASVMLLLSAAYHTARDRRMFVGSTELPPDALPPVEGAIAGDD